MTAMAMPYDEQHNPLGSCLARRSYLARCSDRIRHIEHLAHSPSRKQDALSTASRTARKQRLIGSSQTPIAPARCRPTPGLRIDPPMAGKTHARDISAGGIIPAQPRTPSKDATHLLTHESIFVASFSFACCTSWRIAERERNRIIPRTRNEPTRLISSALFWHFTCSIA